LWLNWPDFVDSILNIQAAISCDDLFKLYCDLVCEWLSNAQKGSPLNALRDISLQGDISGLISNSATAALVKHIVPLDTK